MNAHSALQYNSLGWVKKQLDAVLTEAQSCLSEYIENNTNEGALKDCIESLKLVYGTLQMVEVYGASMLAEEMEQTAIAMLEGRVDSKDDVFDVLMRAMLQMPDYLEGLQAGNKDSAIALMPLINDLRAARKESLLSESVLLFPDFGSVVDAESDAEAARAEAGKLGAEAKRLRTHFQLGLLDVLRNNKQHAGFQRMLAVVAALEKVSADASVRRFWSVIAALLESLLEKGIDTSVSIKMLLGGIDRQIRLLVDAGEEHFADAFSQELLKNILYYIGHSKGTGKRQAHIRSIYKLDELMPGAAVDTGAGGLNVELFATVSQGIKEDVAKVKDSLEIFVHKERQDVSELEPLLEQLGRIGDTFGMLGLGATRQKVLDQKDKLENIVKGGAGFSEAIVEDIANDLLGAESDLNNYIAQRSGYISTNDEQGVIPAAEYREVLTTVVNQGLQNFSEAREAILAYLAGNGDHAQLENVLQLLEEVRGVSLMLSMDTVESMLSKLKDYVRIVLLDNRYQPDLEEQDTIADVITSIEYFLEAMSEGRPGVEQGLRTGAAAADRLTEVYSAFPSVRPAEPVAPVEGAVGEEKEAAIPAPGKAAVEMPVAEPESKAEMEALHEAVTEQPESEQYEILSADADEEILEIFIEEALEVLEELHGNLPRLKSNCDDEDALTIVRRCFHTLKGSGRLVGAHLIGEFSWKFEKLLNRVLDKRIDLDNAAMKVLDEAVVVIPQLVEQLRGNREPVPNVYQLMAAAEALAEGRPAQEQPVAKIVAPVPAEITVEEELVAEQAGEEVTGVAGETVVLKAPETVGADELIELEEADADEMFGYEAVDVYAPDEAIEAEETAKSELAEEISIGEAVQPEPETQLLDISEHEDVGMGMPVEAVADSGEELSLSLEEVAAYADEGAMDEAQALEGVEGEEMPAETVELTGELEADEFGYDEVVLVPEGEELEGVGELGESMEAPALDEAALEQQPVEDQISIEIDESVPELAEDLENAVHMDPELFRIYYDESLGYLEQLRDLLAAHHLQHAPLIASKDLVRTFHTLYGSARTAEIDQIAELCGAMEKYVKVRQEADDLSITEDIIELIENLEQKVGAMLEEIRAGNTPAFDRDLLDRINKVVQAELQDQLQQSTARGLAGSVAEPEIQEVPEAVEQPLEQPTEQRAEQPAIHLPETVDESAGVLISYSDIDDDLIDIFLEEADELLESCEESLVELNRNPDDTDNIRQIQRYMHTLKGGARMAELTPVGDLTHLLESLVVKVADKQVSADKVVFDLLNESIDRLASMLKSVKVREPVLSASDLVSQLETLIRGEIPEKRTVERFDIELKDLEAGTETAAELAGEEAVPAVKPAAEVIPYERRESDRAQEEEEKPHWGERATDVTFRESHEQIRVRADLLNMLVNSAGEVMIYHARMGKQMSDIVFNLAELDSTVTRLKEQLRNMEIETEIQIRSTYAKETDHYDEDFDPLEMDRYSTLQQLSRSLTESAGDVESIKDILNDIVRDSETLLMQESRVSIDLQEGLMRTRMVRFGGLATRLRRIVRQTSKELGKEVSLDIVGETSEVDRSVLDRIIAPLEHMLRNAVAHGIENPKERIAAGKPETGKIKITVDREGADVVIRVEDDGAGIDVDRIREKAISTGLLEADNKLSDHDVLQLIMKSGFSTAKNITQVAGRGVGMDVVDAEIKQLGGILEIDTRKGKGTAFNVRLPLTLAINQALLVNANDEVYAVPLTSIEGVVRITGAELQQFYDSEHYLYEFNNVQYELNHLGKILTGHQPDYSRQFRLFPVLLAKVGDQHFALHVDDLVGRREIVVKPVGHQISGVRGIAGATILADGRVVLILEMSALVVGESLFKPTEEATEVELAPPKEKAVTTVMVVDDSITIRKVTARMLERNGIQVLLAKDGVDATNMLQDHMPDLMLLDIEMPRMDGFELASYIRNDDRLKELPIIMITSRTGAKHKEKAMEIGVNEYLGKPYQEEELMMNINKILQLAS